ncbi:MAG: U32 family peptidase, partial [Bacteroidales bacterium]|nr:U32 family peptidase [Bacteroidales bacterium]
EGTFDKDKLETWNLKLENVYNRGFWDGYYLGRKMGEWTEQYGSLATKRKVYVGKVTNYFSKLGVAEIKMETQELHVGDEFKIIGPTTGVYEDFISEIRVDLKPVEKTVKGEDCSIPVKEPVRRGDKVYRIVDSEIA